MIKEPLKEREILYRLMRRKEDGSYKVVGYEKHRLNKINFGKRETFYIWHSLNSKPGSWRNILSQNDINKGSYFIHHYRKDQYTGIDIDGQKVFERDNIEVTRSTECIDGIVKMVDLCWMVIGIVNNIKCSLSYTLADGIKKVKLIGIEGVNDKK